MATKQADLPTDILNQIVEEVYRPRRNNALDQVSRPSYLASKHTVNQMTATDSQKTLQALRLISHSWRNAATPLLFRNVVVYSISKSTVRKLNGLATTPYLANAVRELVCLPQIFREAHNPDTCVYVGEQYISEQDAILTAGSLTMALISALQAFPHLFSLALDYQFYDKYRTCQVVPAIMSYILSCPLPNLSHLVLRGMELAPYVPIGSVLSSLTRLHITFFSSPFSRSNLGIPARIPLLLLALPNLTSLSLILSSCHDEKLAAIDWAPARLQQLRHLKLKDVNLSEKAIFDLVTGSAATLEKLEIHEVWLKDSSWASIYTTFQTLLGALTNITVAKSRKYYVDRWNGHSWVQPRYSDSDRDCFYALSVAINRRRAEKDMSATGFPLLKSAVPRRLSRR